MEGATHPTGRGFGSLALHRYALFLCAATFVLVFAGGLVTSTESGLSVPDWPLSFGQVFPPMEGGVLYEHGHRMIAASVGLLTIGLCLWAWIGVAGRAVRVLAACALGTVIVQGLLGGMTVLLGLPPAVSIAHACLAQAFLCMTVALAAMTGPSWASPPPVREERGTIPLRFLVVATAAAVYGQLILGAVVRHTKAGLAIPTFPLAWGRIVPAMTSAEVQIHFAHRVWAIVVAVLAGAVFVRVVRDHAEAPLLRLPAVLLSVLVLTQIMLGGLVIWSGRGVIPTTMHVLFGAMVLATAFLLALRTWQIVAVRKRAEERARVAEGAPA